MFQRTKICTGLLVAFGSDSLRSPETPRRAALHRAMQLSVPAIASAMLSLSAVAQTDPAANGSGDATQQRVTVTGSMIARTNAETSEAITIISAESLKDMGITTVEGALAQVASNQSGVVTATEVGLYSGGASFASLRGLGGSKTLVLLDGQRLANNVVYGSAVDLNGIPFAAIDHIEVLREGASSVYGADAIAGVVNFITKKNLKGGEFNVEASHPQLHGGATSNADITFGKGDLSADGYNFLVAGNYTHTKNLRGYERSFASGFNPPLGLTNTNGAGTTPGMFFDQAGNGYQVNAAGCPTNPYPTTFVGECDYKYSEAVDLIPESSNASGVISLTKALDQRHTLAFQYLLTRSKVNSWGGPQTYVFNMTAAGDPTYFPTLANSTFIPKESSSATAVAPDLADPITVVWTDPGNNRFTYDTNREQRALLTFTGSDHGWDYSVNTSFSKNNNTQGVTGGYPVLSDLNVTDSDGDSVLNPLINPFGTQTQQGQDVLDSSYRSGDLAKGSLSLWEVNLQGSHEIGDFFSAGQATVAIGFDARGEKIHFATTGLTPILNNVTAYPVETINGSRTEQAVFAELNIPITKQLEATVSDRQDRYSDFGNTNNGKIAFRYQPSKLVTLRGAASTGFRAPSMVDMFSPQTFGAGDNIVGPQCDAGGNTPPFNAAICNTQGLVLSGGNPNLKPERSQNMDLGIVLAPAPGWGITLDWYRILIKNEIHAISSTTIYDNFATLGGLFHPATTGPDAGFLSPASKLAADCPNGQNSTSCGYISSTTTNTGGIQTSGVDVSTNYELRSAQGNFRFGLEGTWVNAFHQQSYAGAPWLNTRGQWNQGNAPSLTWQHMLTIDWTKDAWGAGLSEHYESSYVDEFPTADGSIRKVGASSIWNGYGSFKVTSYAKLTFGVRNLFNTNPSFSNQTTTSAFQGGYNITLADPTGRAYYARATIDF